MLATKTNPSVESVANETSMAREPRGASAVRDARKSITFPVGLEIKKK